MEELARIVASNCGNFKMHVINLLPIQEQIVANCPEEETTILVRRFMMRIAQEIAKNTGCGMLITGENLGQVASQTLESMHTINAVTSMPIIRPVATMDKVEIIDLARKVGTYETSIQPWEDCCTIFTPKNPVTKPTIRRAEALERRFDFETLLEACVEQTESVHVYPTKPAEEEVSDLF